MTSTPPGPARVIWILARTGLRRWTSRVSVQFRRKKKAAAGPAAPRAGTPRKRKGGWLLLLFLGGIFFWNSLVISAQFLGKLGIRLRQTDIAEEAQEKEISRRRAGDGGFVLFFSGRIWPAEGKEEPLVRAVGLVLLLLALGQLASALGLGNQDLGAVSWSMEWLFTLPVPASVLFLAKVLEYTLVNALGWFMTLPFLIALYWSAGLGARAIPLGIAAAGCSLMIVAAFRMAAETFLRKTCSLVRLKSLQAVFTVAGMVLLALVFWVAMGPEVPASFFKLADGVPGIVLWNPFSLPVFLCRGDLAPWLAAGGLAVYALLLAWGATRAAQWLVRDGLIVAAGAYRGERLPAGAQAKERARLPGGILGKELRLVLRDRNLLVQTLVVPLFMFGIQIAINPALLRGVGGDLRHASALAFGVGAYVLIFSAFQVLSMEGHALWILYTVPRDLHTILFQKTFLWCGVATFYTALILAGAALSAPSFGLDAFASALLALAGVALHAFIAAGIGILATDPLETEASRKANPVMIYLYLFIASLFANAIYQPSAWSKIAQLVLSTVLTFALWQKVRDRLPYLLDPTAAPPPRIALSDGLIAALSFFVLQGILTIGFAAGGMPIGESLFYSFTIAGAVVGLFSLYVFWRMKVPRLLEAVGLWFTPGSFLRSLATGIPAGGAAALLGLAYVKLVDKIEPLRQLKAEALELRAGMAPDTFVWIGILAVLVAPLFEEYIFRGLVYRGMRRSAGPLAAMLLSAALFAIVHPPIAVIPVFILGLAAAFSLERAGSLLAPILAHMVYNAAVIGTS